jgi:hypothetical protein
VNAIPSGSRTPATRCRGESDTRRDFAAASVPSRSVDKRTACAGTTGRAPLLSCGHGGSRHAKTVCRGALSLRRTAQGRVGDFRSPRHVAFHLASHLLLSAPTSASAGAIRPLGRDGAKAPHLPRAADRAIASRFRAQPGISQAAHDGSQGFELAQSGPDVAHASACAQSRGKGVLAA